jgi:hypothetical protein
VVHPRRRLAIGGGALAVALVIATVVVLIVNRGDSSPHAAASPTPSVSTSTAVTTVPTSPSDSPTWTTATGSGTPPVSEPAARAVVEEYIGAVNARQKTAAAALICASDRERWQQNADSPRGDFAYTVTNFEFLGSRPDQAGHGIVVGYRLTFDDGTSNQVQFTVVVQKGPKLCGITQL